MPAGSSPTRWPSSPTCSSGWASTRIALPTSVAGTSDRDHRCRPIWSSGSDRTSRSTTPHSPVSSTNRPAGEGNPHDHSSALLLPRSPADRADQTPVGPRHPVAPAPARSVPVDKLLLGAQNGVAASLFAKVYGDPRWPSRRVTDGPHADLLDRVARGPMTDDDILASPYGRMARACIQHTGRYFAAMDQTGIVDQARQFIARTDDEHLSVRTGDHHSVPGLPILVSPIADSDCYQVLDGHHRIAAAGPTRGDVRAGPGAARERQHTAAGPPPVDVVAQRRAGALPARELAGARQRRGPRCVAAPTDSRR